MKEELKKIELFADALPVEFNNSKAKLLEAVKDIKDALDIKELYDRL